MKITKEYLTQIIKEELEKTYKHPLARGIQVVKTGETVRPEDPDDPHDEMAGYKDTTYDILDQQGNKIGFLEYDNYFGDLDGELYDRYLPRLQGYRSHGSGPLGKLQSFFKSKTGKKWLDVSQRSMQKQSPKKNPKTDFSDF